MLVKLVKVSNPMYFRWGTLRDVTSGIREKVARLEPLGFGMILMKLHYNICIRPYLIWKE